eukprot:scaffold426_cov219-Amphora_coffeaeformis.AAC.67
MLGNLRFDNPDEPPILCTSCFRDEYIEFGMKSNGEWYRQCKIWRLPRICQPSRIAQESYGTEALMKTINVEELVEFTAYLRDEGTGGQAGFGKNQKLRLNKC